MAESEAVQTVVTQVAIQAVTVAVMALRETDTEPPVGTSAVGSGEACRYRHDKPALKQPSCNWNVSDKYVELLSFEMEVMNILQTKTNELIEGEKVPIIKSWLGRDGWQLILTYTDSEKEAYDRVEGLFSIPGEKFNPDHRETMLSCNTVS